MTHTQILFRSDAREKVTRGAARLADAVRITLGPKSTSVLIQRKWGPPLVCNDGVMIAKQINPEDPEENLGAKMMRQPAKKTGETAGDDTSTATVLANAVFADGVRNVVAGASAVDLKHGLDRGLRAAIASLRATSRPVKTRREKAQVATISAHNDPTMGELVVDAMEKVGGEGVITVEESKTTETVLEVVEGLQFDRGYVSPYFVLDPDKMEVTSVRSRSDSSIRCGAPVRDRWQSPSCVRATTVALIFYEVRGGEAKAGEVISKNQRHR